LLLRPAGWNSSIENWKRTTLTISWRYRQRARLSVSLRAWSREAVQLLRALLLCNVRTRRDSRRDSARICRRKVSRLVVLGRWLRRHGERVEAGAGLIPLLHYVGGFQPLRCCPVVLPVLLERLPRCRCPMGLGRASLKVGWMVRIPCRGSRMVLVRLKASV
jgi:hypothetical protein